MVGIEGEIIGETRNTLIIQTPKGRKTVLKAIITLEVDINGRKTIIDGRTIVGKPENRTRKGKRNDWQERKTGKRRRGQAAGKGLR